MLLSKMQPLLNKSSDFNENLIRKFIFTQDNQTRSEIDTIKNGQIKIYVRLILIYLIIIGFILLLLIRLKN